MMIRFTLQAIAALALASCAASQDAVPKPQPKPFKPPAFRLLHPVLAKDEGCMRDLAKGTRMDGLEQRKYIADLFIFGCVQRLEGVFSASITQFRDFGTGSDAVPARRVFLVDQATAKDYTGWILANELSPSIIDAIIESLPARRSEKK